MTSAERHEARYQRRVQTRLKKRRRYQSYDEFDTVFSYEHLYQSYRKCRRGVSWKGSVQKYITQAPLNIYRTQKRLQNGSFRSSGFYEFDVTERGKQRHIRSVTISERVVQRCLCDYALVPTLSKTFIYDNGACLENKGYTFASRRVSKMLHDHYRKHGDDGYVLIFDFSKFFDNVSQENAKATLDKLFTDSRIKALTGHFIDMFGDRGLGLGSQISQVLALSSANRLDHYIKEKLRIKGYVRYMDDGFLIHPSKAYLQKCLADIKILCSQLEIKLNTKKTHITKLRRGFTFLKIQYRLLPSGRVLKRLSHASIVHMRRKLVRLKRKVDDHRLSAEDVYQSFQSWKAYASQFNAYQSIQAVSRLYTRLFMFQN